MWGLVDRSYRGPSRAESQENKSNICGLVYNLPTFTCFSLYFHLLFLRPSHLIITIANICTLLVEFVREPIG